MKYVTPLVSEIFQFNLIDQNSPYRTSGYLIKGDKNIIIETGSSFSNPVILNGLRELNINPEQIDYIIVTHIHLDHAGGAGLLMSQCANATLIVHKKGKPHLVNPDKLIAGARLVYGNKFDGLFNPILPVEEKRIQVMDDNDELNLGLGRVIRFLDTPGHAFHHLAVYDPASNGIFTGDSAGIFFNRMFADYGIPYCLPVTSPTQFAPEIMESTLSRLMELKPKRLYFTHFGMGESAMELLKQSKDRVSFFGTESAAHYRKHGSYGLLVDFIQQKLVSELKMMGIPDNFPDAPTLLQDIKLNAQGIIANVDRQEKADKQAG